MTNDPVVLNVRFPNSAQCLGKDFERILKCLESETVNCHWFVFDVSGPHAAESFPPYQGMPFSYITSTEDLIRLVRLVDQFLSGVFIAMDRGSFPAWDLASLPETEAEPGLQHCMAVVEIRPFDTTYFEISGRQPYLQERLRGCLSGSEVSSS